jgi:hypothetical protein
MINSEFQPDECQAVDLGNNTVLVNARSDTNRRLQVGVLDCFLLNGRLFLTMEE